MTDTLTASAENRIRAAMRQLLGGPVPDGLKCDVKSLCQLSGVPRATFYRTYPHLRAEFEEQRGIGRAAGQQPDPRLAQIDRLESRSHRAAGTAGRKASRNRRSQSLSHASAVAPGRRARRTHLAAPAHRPRRRTEPSSTDRHGSVDDCCPSRTACSWIITPGEAG